MRVRKKVLTRAQTRALTRLAPLMAERSFYLAGGTALALQIGHRRSVDLDWFSEAPLTNPLRFARELQDAGMPLRIERAERGTLHGTVFGVRVSFFEYRYPLLRPLLRPREPSLRTASPEDIACMKLAAVAQRGSRKDFVDLYALGRRMPLVRMLALYGRKYGVQDPGHLLYALSYFDDAERERMPKLLRPWDWASIKQTIQRWVARAAR